MNQSLEKGVMKASLTAGSQRMEIGTWNFGVVGANTNMEGPLLKAVLPRWKTDRFILHLEVEGHPEYNSSYTFLLSQ
jgi:hypothetical protein